MLPPFIKVTAAILAKIQLKHLAQRNAAGVAQWTVGATIELELIEAQDWEKTTQRHLPYKGPGVYHFGLRVADVDAAVAELESAEVPVIDHVPREGDNMRVSFLHPDAAQGTLIELVMKKNVKREG